MPLAKNDWNWLSSFSGGAVSVPAAHAPAAGSLEESEQKLKALQSKEQAADQARKQVMLEAATKRLLVHKEDMRKAFDMKVEVYAKKDGAEQDKARAAEGKAENAKTKTLDTRAADGDQRKALDTDHHAGRIKGLSTDKLRSEDKLKTEVAAELKSAGEMMALIVQETDALSKATTSRSVFDAETGKIVTETVELFTAKEISDEIYTPMVREKVIGENFVPPKFSATQRMLDGSNEHYLNECKEKGGRIGLGKTEIAKSTLALASATTSTVLSALAPVEEGQKALSASGKLGKEAAARADQINKGITALLTAGMDVGKAINDRRQEGQFEEGAFKRVLNGIALGLGKTVAGATGNNDIGMAVTNGVLGAGASVKIGQWIAKRAKGDASATWGSLVDEVGNAVGSSLSAGGVTNDQKAKDALAAASPLVSGAFKAAAKAQEKDVLRAVSRGDYKTVLLVLGDAGVESAKAFPTAFKYNPDAATKTEFADQVDADDTAGTRNNFVDDAGQKIGDAVPGASRIPGSGLAGRVADKLTPETMKRNAVIDDAFEKRKRELEKEADAAEEDDLNKKQAIAREEYQKSLSCLGSANVDEDTKYKSIAVLIQQIETDRAIWAAITAIATGGAAVAAQFVPGLKAAGELVQFTANIKEAADRMKALLDWREAQKDATSAVSPYASSIENMIRNQAEQFSHYSIQAAANAIKAVLAAGELSPYAPAFKVAGATVGLAASAEELIYKSYKQAMLVRAWSKTQKALKNPNDRILGLTVREMNPTLAKYTLAFGALIEHDQVAITACGRIGLDRETLARTGDKVRDVKDFMQTLYKDDNVVLGQVDAVQGGKGVPAPVLTAKAWSMSHMVWSEAKQLTDANPPAIVAGLARVGRAEAKNGKLDYSELTDRELEAYHSDLTDLALAFRDYRPAMGTGGGFAVVVDTIHTYEALATARQERVSDALEIRREGVPAAQPVPA